MSLELPRTLTSRLKVKNCSETCNFANIFFLKMLITHFLTLALHLFLRMTKKSRRVATVSRPPLYSTCQHFTFYPSNSTTTVKTRFILCFRNSTLLVKRENLSLVFLFCVTKKSVNKSLIWNEIWDLISCSRSPQVFLPQVCHLADKKSRKQPFSHFFKSQKRFNLLCRRGSFFFLLRLLLIQPLLLSQDESGHTHTHCIIIIKKSQIHLPPPPRSPYPTLPFPNVKPCSNFFWGWWGQWKRERERKGRRKTAKSHTSLHLLHISKKVSLKISL